MNLYYFIPALFFIPFNFNKYFWLSYIFSLIMYSKYSMKRTLKNEFIKGERFALGGIQKDESAEWLNIILKKIWTFYEPVLCENLRKEIKPVLDKLQNKVIQKMELGKLTFGKNAPFIISSRVLNSMENRIVLDCVLGFIAPDLDIILFINYLPFGVEQVFFRGKLRLELDLIPDFPHVKTCLITFLEKPTVNFNLVPLKLNLMNIPGISIILSDLVNKIIKDQLVYPNRKILTIINNTLVNKFEFSGLLFVRIKSITGKDQLLNTSIKLTSNLCEFKENISHGFIYPMIVDKNPNIDLLMLNISNSLTSITLKKAFVKLPLESKQLCLEISKTFKINFEMEFEPFNETLNAPSGVFQIIIHSAKDLLPINFNGLSDPYCVIYSNDSQIFKTPVIQNTLAPIWNSSFEFAVNDISQLKIKIKVFDYDNLPIHRQIGQIELDSHEFINIDNKWISLKKGFLCLSTKFFPIETPVGFENFQTILERNETIPTKIVKSCTCFPF